MLWNRSLVMIDKETGSLWSHILGRAMQGPLEGNDLEVLPSTMTDWHTWQTLHPQTTVALLTPTARGFERQMYRRPENFVVGLRLGDRSRAWPYDRLWLEGLVNDQLGDVPLVVFFERNNGTALVFGRRHGEQTLSFELRDGRIVDTTTGSTWDPYRGRAMDGPLGGAQLKPLPAIVSFRQAWTIFHPDGDVYGE